MDMSRLESIPKSRFVVESTTVNTMDGNETNTTHFQSYFERYWQTEQNNKLEQEETDIGDAKCSEAMTEFQAQNQEKLQPLENKVL